MAGHRGNWHPAAVKLTQDMTLERHVVVTSCGSVQIEPTSSTMADREILLLHVRHVVLHPVACTAAPPSSASHSPKDHLVVVDTSCTTRLSTGTTTMNQLPSRCTDFSSAHFRVGGPPLAVLTASASESTEAGSLAAWRYTMTRSFNLKLSFASEQLFHFPVQVPLGPSSCGAEVG